MLYILMAVFAAVVVGLDQYTKYLTVANIPRWGSVPAIPGLFDLTYVQNTGAAWSSFEGQIWLFALIFAVFAGFIIWEFPKKRMGFRTSERWCIVAVFAGGLGNMIDRVRLGFVVDMIRLEFMDFPVFNVADCFICCGCIALIVLLLFNKEFWKEEKHDSTDECGSGGGETGCLSDQNCGGADPSEGTDCHRGGACDPAGEESQEERQV